MKKLIAFVLGLFVTLPAISAGLPSGYTELEYIESDGSQYINTGYTPTTAGYSADVKFMLTGGSLIAQNIIGFNTEISGVRERMSFGTNNSGSVVFGYASGSTGYSNDGTSYMRLNDIINLNIVFTIPISLTIDGTKVATFNSATRNNTAAVYLMGVNNSAGDALSIGRWYSAKIYDDKGALIRDFVPAQHGNDVGMYDVAHDQFYTDANGGNFVAGEPVAQTNTCNNLFDKNAVTTGGYVGHADGEWHSANGYNASDFIPVTAGAQYTRSGNGFSADNSVAFFDSSKNFVSAPSVYFSQSRPTITIPSGVAYMRILVQDANLDTTQIEQGSTATPYCTYRGKIKIATTKYNNNAFSGVVTALNNAVDTIKTVVANTINQATAVANLQTGKQQRPNPTDTNGTCPNYRQCLLVEDNQGNPYWYVITDPFRDLFSPVIANNIAAVSTTYQVGVPSEYTQLEYIKFTGTQYIDTGLTLTSNSLPFLIDVDISFADQSGRYLTGFSSSSPGYAGRKDGGRFEINNTYTTMTSGVNQRLNFKYGNIASKNNRIGIQVTKDDQTEYVLHPSSTSISPSSSSWIIFANHEGSNINSYLKGNIYFAKAYKNGVLRFNGIPVSKVENGVTVAGLFDTVSGNFFGNNGTGSIIAGDPVPNQTTQWTATFGANDTYGYGRSIVYGTAKCNATSGSANDVATSTQMSANNWTATGSNCWCYAERVNETNSGVSGTSANRWVYLTVPSGETCAANCVENCANAVASGAVADKPFRQALTGL